MEHPSDPGRARRTQGDPTGTCKDPGGPSRRTQRNLGVGSWTHEKPGDDGRTQDAAGGNQTETERQRRSQGEAAGPRIRRGGPEIESERERERERERGRGRDNDLERKGKDKDNERESERERGRETKRERERERACDEKSFKVRLVVIKSP